MVDGDPELAQAVTHWTISDIQHDGTMIMKTILVPWIIQLKQLQARPYRADMPPMPKMDLDDTAQKTKSTWVWQLIRANLN